MMKPSYFMVGWFAGFGFLFGVIAERSGWLTALSSEMIVYIALGTPVALGAVAVGWVLGDILKEKLAGRKERNNAGR